METSEGSRYKIPVMKQHGRGFVYDADDYLKLRFTHRIPGNLIGVPVSKPRNAHSFALPAVLSPYELKLALEKCLVVLIDRESALQKAPSESAKVIHAQIASKQLAEQKEPFMEKRLAEFSKYLPRIIEGKKKKLLKSGANEEDIVIDPEQLMAEEKERLEATKIDKLLQIPLEHPVTIESSIASFELTDGELLKYNVFKDIWEKQGVYISPGDAFGCDFLLYPGDPLYYHASHMIHVLVDETQRLDIKYLIRCCRLSVVVNKICIFAYKGDNGKISYQTMEWQDHASIHQIRHGADQTAQRSSIPSRLL